MFWDNVKYKKDDNKYIRELEMQNSVLKSSINSLQYDNYRLEEKIDYIKNLDIPDFIEEKYDFEEFCNDCNNFDITCNIDTISSLLGGEKVYTNLTCEHINTCRRMYDKFKKENKNNVDL